MKAEMASARKVIWDTWDEFWQATSIPAIVNAGKSRKSFLRRLIWLILFGAMFYGSMFQIVKVVKDFFDYPVTVGITISNLNQVRSL